MPARTVDVKIEFLWDDTNWVDETQYFIEANGAYEFIPPGDAFQTNRQLVQQMTVVMANVNNRFSLHHPDSVFASYPGKAYHKRCRILIYEDGVWTYVFFGYVKVPNEGIASNRVTFVVWDVGEMLKRRFSTQIYTNKLEHELVIDYLKLAGLNDGKDFISPLVEGATGQPRTIDYSSARIPFSWLDDEEVWGELGLIAQATGSQVFVDRDGFVNYRKGWRWATIDNYEPIGPDDYMDVTITYDDRAYYDMISVEYADRKRGQPGTELWSLPKARLINPQDQIEITAQFSNPAISVDSPVAGEDYFLSYVHNADAYDVASLTMVTYAQRAEITVVNSSVDSPVILSSMKITGQPLTGRPSEKVEKQLGNNYFGRELAVSGNPYIMRKYQAESVASFLSWWCKDPKPVLSIKSMRGKSSRVVGAGVLVDVFGTTFQGVIIKNSWRISIKKNEGVSFTQDIVVLANDHFSGSNDGSPSSPYFILDQDLLDGPKVTWH